jgi:hypothetical protein
MHLNIFCLLGSRAMWYNPHFWKSWPFPEYVILKWTNDWGNSRYIKKGGGELSPSSQGQEPCLSFCISTALLGGSGTTKRWGLMGS